MRLNLRFIKAEFMSANNKKFVPIGTKVTFEALEQMKTISKVTGVSIYVFLQVIIDAVLKTLFTEDVQNESVNEILRLFVDFKKAKDGFTLLSPTVQNLFVSQILGIIQQKDKSVPEVVAIRMNDAGEMMTNRNNDEILKTFLCAFSPALLEKLEKIKVEYSKGTLTAALAFAICEAMPSESTISDEIKSLFEDANTIVCSSDFSKPERTKEAERTAQIENLSSGVFENVPCKYTRGRNWEEFERQESKKAAQRQLEQRRAGVEFVSLNEYEDETFCFDDD